MAPGEVFKIFLIFFIFLLKYFPYSTANCEFSKMSNSKIILYGGSFDPIHRGHLAMMQFAMQHLQADKGILIPAGISPLKRRNPYADGALRIEMIHRAIQTLTGVEVSDYELNRPGPSYTIDTVRYFRHQAGRYAQLYWLLGADAVAELPYWHQIGQLAQACRLCVMYRGGYPMPKLDLLTGVLTPAQIEQLKTDVLATPLIDISSTAIRQAIAAGQDVSGHLPDGVWEYIQSNNLYQ